MVIIGTDLVPGYKHTELYKQIENILFDSINPFSSLLLEWCKKKV